MHILIAPNAFKNSVTATDAATYIEKGLIKSRLDCTTERFPVADGGDGTGELIIRQLNGKNISGTFQDPLGRRITANYGLIDEGRTAVIEMAAASGIRLLEKNELDPMSASSEGTGEMIVSALDRGAKKIIIAIGGSATVDGGCGILHTLGIRFLNKDGEQLRAVPQELRNVDAIDVSGLDGRIHQCEIQIWCDVKNKLLGKTGAAAVFGPQKGATPQQVGKLESVLQRLNGIATKMSGKDVSQLESGGAAGGTAAFLHAFLNAKLVNGIERFLKVTGFEKALESADLVITGEGEIDRQTLDGKGPYGVAAEAGKKDIPVIALAGRVPLENDPELARVFAAVLPIGHQPLSLDESIRLTAQNLERISTQIGNLLAVGRRIKV